ncbi:MAG: YitT family protein [Candidatus Izemoplasma sp.]|nr:YitT family protein [Candidatus Izemoplasma sp.]
MDKHRIRPISHPERYGWISLGIILMASGFYFFLIPVDLVAGGVTGIGMILNEVSSKISISLTVFAMNMVLLLVGWIVLGTKLFLRSIYGSLLFPFVLFILEQFVPLLNIENDYVIAVTFGGALLGLGFGYVLKYGGTSGGTDIPVKILNRVFNLPISFSVYLIDGLIVLAGTIVFSQSGSVLVGLYAIIAIAISGKVADMVVVGGTSKKALQIITDYPQEIKKSIYDSISRGVTEVPIKGGYSESKKIMLITVITKREYYLVRNVISHIDETAFVYVTPATEIHGEFLERESDDL